MPLYSLILFSQWKSLFLLNKNLKIFYVPTMPSFYLSVCHLRLSKFCDQNSLPWDSHDLWHCIHANCVRSLLFWNYIQVNQGTGWKPFHNILSQDMILMIFIEKHKHVGWSLQKCFLFYRIMRNISWLRRPLNSQLVSFLFNYYFSLECFFMA